MPEYGTSLGCEDSNTYSGLIFTDGALHPEAAQHSLDIRGGAVGTVHILQGDPDATDDLDADYSSHSCFSTKTDV